jgi:hypothetical protein
MATTKITSPDLFNLESLNTALKLPSGTTAERPTSPSTGEWRYNTTTNLVEFWDGGEWRDLQSENIPPINSENFNTVVYTGNGSTQSITGVGFEPDFVWIKPTSFVDNHALSDSSRGVDKSLASNTTAAEQSLGVTSFDADGFSLPNWGNVNQNGETFVAWCWKANGGTTSSNTDGTITSTVQANTKTGFSIVQYTGTQSNATVGHGLGVAPSLVITKAVGAANGWPTLVQANSSTRYDGLRLNEANLNNSGNGAAFFQNKTPTDSVFYLGNSDESNRNGTATIAYCFAEVAGFSSIGGYSGNGSDNGPIINTGFEPAWLMIKVVTGTADGWFMVDNKRDTSNPRGIRVFANSDVGDASEAGAQVDFFTNGFQLRGSGAGQGQTNKSGSTYVYIAFAADTSAAPTLADGFGISGYVGNASTKIVNNSGFSPSLVWLKDRSSSQNHYLQDTVRGLTSQISSNLTAAATTYTSNITSFNDNGFTLGTATDTNAENHAFVGWQWKGSANPTINTDGTIQSIVSANQAAGFSVVAWTGDGSASATVGHGLSGTPDFIMLKDLTDVGGWNGSQVGLASNEGIGLQSTAAAFTGMGGNGGITYGNFNATNFGFATGSSGVDSVNKNGNKYIAYCWKSVAGFSKFGAYTGNGSTTGPVVTTGFKPDFVMYKATDQTGNWGMLDSVRGETQPITEWMGANLANEESFESTRQADFLDTGFQPKGTNSDINTNGANYIYMAYKMNPPALSIPTGKMAFLNVAGGGGGGGKTSSGNTRGGGGGGGGLKTSYGTLSGGGASAESNITLAAGTYTITVGAGGGKSTGSGTGISGGDSSIAGPSLTTITSAGGGGGGDFQVQGAAGGSGGGYGGAGGTGTTTCAGGAGTASQGFNGGGVNGGSGVDAGGGGGAGECGGFGVFRQAYGGVGGSGLMVTITSNAKYYAGGGGGGSDSNGLAPRLGGVGGGGYGASGPVGGVGNISEPGVVNTGGGGGGEGSNGTPGDGGSGIVVIRLNTSDYSGTTTGSPTVTTDGVYTILEYTGSGTYVHS